MKIPKELIKEYVKSEKFTNTADIMESIKSMFADVLNEVLQCEMDEQLGYFTRCLIPLGKGRLIR